MWLSCFTFWHCHCHTWKINLITFVKLHFQPPTCWVELTISLGGRIVGVRVRKIICFIKIKWLWGWEWDNVGWYLSNIGNKWSMMAIWEMTIYRKTLLQSSDWIFLRWAAKLPRCLHLTKVWSLRWCRDSPWSWSGCPSELFHCLALVYHCQVAINQSLDLLALGETWPKRRGASLPSCLRLPTSPNT